MKAPAAGPREFVLLALLSAIWGGSFMLIKLALGTVPPTTIAAGRLAVAALALSIIARLAGVRLPRGPRDWAPFFVLGFLSSALPFVLIGWGERRIDSALAAILTGVMPLATATLAHLFTADERFTRAKAVGLASGFAGLVVLVGGDALAGLGQQIAGQLAVVGAALCYAGNTVYARRLGPRPPLATATASMIAAVVMILPASLVIDAPWRLAPDATALWAIAALGLAATAGGMLIFYELVRTAGATTTALVNYLVPLAGVGWGAAVLGERPSIRAFVALGLILLGVALNNRRSKRTKAAARDGESNVSP